MIRACECEARDFTRSRSIAAQVAVVRCRGCGAVQLEPIEPDDLDCGAVHLEQLEQLEPDNTQHPHHTDRDEATP